MFRREKGANPSRAIVSRTALGKIARETGHEEWCILPARAARRDWREQIERVYAAEPNRVGRVLETDVLFSSSFSPPPRLTATPVVERREHSAR